MSNYIISNGELYNTDELTHYGVPGMKWGKRKARYVTAYQAQKKATKAAEQARKDSIAKDRASGLSGVGSFAKANRKALAAKRKAYGKSIASDIAYNKQLRAEKKNLVPNKKENQTPWGHNPKSERQQRYEDDHGINPNRPNGTKTRGQLNDKVRLKEISKKNPTVAKGVAVAERILDINNKYSRKY